MPNNGRRKAGSLNHKRRMFINPDATRVQFQMYRLGGKRGKYWAGQTRTFVPPEICQWSRYDWNMCW